MSEEAYLNLANSVLIRAAKDYRFYRRRALSMELGVVDAYERRIIQDRIAEIENFFLSDYGMILSRGHSRLILESLKNEF